MAAGDAPVLGVTLDQYAQVVAGGIGDPDQERAYARAATLGINRTTWNQASVQWQERVGEAGEDSDLGRQYRHLLMTALRRECGEVKALDFERYLATGISIRPPSTASFVTGDEGPKLLDTESRAAGCTHCGATLALPLGATRQLQYQCGFCQAHHRLQRQ